MAEIPEQPKKSAGDFAYGVVKAAVSGVPLAGGPVAELLGLVFGPPLEKRRAKWLEELAGAVRELQERVADLTPEKLSQDESFVTVALRATEIASTTHHQEKIDALRNAVLNSALPGAPDETLEQIFLNYVELLTPWHLKILEYFSDPQGWRAKRGLPQPNVFMGSAATLLEQSIPELAGQRPFYDQLIADLDQRGLLVGGNWSHTTMTAQGMSASRSTAMGDQFLRFVSRP